MKNKIDILQAFHECVVTLVEASQEITRACEEVEKLPTNPTRQQAARFRVILTELQASNGLLNESIGNTLKSLENLFSEN